MLQLQVRNNKTKELSQGKMSEFPQKLKSCHVKHFTVFMSLLKTDITSNRMFLFCTFMKVNKMNCVKHSEVFWVFFVSLPVEHQEYWTEFCEVNKIEFNE